MSHHIFLALKFIANLIQLSGNKYSQYAINCDGKCSDFKIETNVAARQCVESIATSSIVLNEWKPYFSSSFVVAHRKRKFTTKRSQSLDKLDAVFANFALFIEQCSSCTKWIWHDIKLKRAGVGKGEALGLKCCKLSYLCVWANGPSEWHIWRRINAFLIAASA